MKKFTDEELEQMSYDDVAYELLKEHGQKMKIMDLFNQVAKILHLSPSDAEKRVSDFFELISTDKRFIMLENGYWDLRINHSHKVVIDPDDDDFIEEVDIESLEEELPEEEVDPDEDPDDDDLQDLVVVNEDELDEML